MQDETTNPWAGLFQKSYRDQGATDVQIQALVTSLSAPLSADEIASLTASQLNPFPKTNPLHATYKPHDVARWVLPAKPLPASYLEFLRWSNGGAFYNEERSFDPFFSSDEIRGYLLSYHIPQYMPGAIPFAFDGGGSFYLFDMRLDPVDGEYPILFVHSGNLGYDDAVLVTRTFPEACQGLSDLGRYEK